MTQHKKQDVVVVGGGLAGLAAAVELAARGLKVTVVEQNPHLGGKMNVLSVDHPDGRGTFTFDMGPTIITLPQVLTGIIRRTGRDHRDYLRLIDLNPQWRCFFQDGTRIDLLRDPRAMAEALDRQFPNSGAGAGYLRFIAFARRMMRLSEKVFFFKDVGSATDLMRGSPVGDPKLLADVLAMRMHSTMAATAHKHIAEAHVRQLVEHFLQYVGSSPFLAPAILSLIAAAQTDHGCWYAMAPDGESGGTRMVARTLEWLGQELGVTVITGVRVTRLETRDGRVTAVTLADGRTLGCDAVVSNCDVQRTCRDLLGTPEALRRQQKIARSYVPACSGVVLYLGLNRRYEHLAHHEFLFSRNSHEEFADIYSRGEPAADPTLYLAVPSRTDPSQAPDGCESLYILVHTAYRRAHHDWRNPDGTPGPLLQRYRRVILDTITRPCFGMEDLEDHIVVERHLTPTDIDTMYNAEGGAIYGLASHGRFVGGFKPRNRSLVYPNLYLAGGSVNPGPGVPMVLMSGVTAAQALLEDAGVAFEAATLGAPVEPDGLASAPKACAPAATQAALAGV
ncbi:MAG: phytoene desaturase [Phycisphaeraceae bacterium]|nr:phytoene desaturase [Phycisphaeraceae bacterium]